MLKEVDLLFITLSSPLLIGVYENQNLIEEIRLEGKSSDELPLVCKELLKKYKPKGLFYANGPGSFMAIKVSYIFLRSLSILKNIPLYARDAFYFNKNAPIKAIGKLYFVKVTSKIDTKRFNEVQECSFELPQKLEYQEFNDAASPLYSIGAV